MRVLFARDPGFASLPVQSVHPETLSSMLFLYDDLFLGGYLQRSFCPVSVTLSSRLTSTAGKFLCTRGPFGRAKDAEIRMSSDFLSRLTQGPFSLNGLRVQTAQEAFLIVFEHELCHAIETSIYKKTGHSSRFLALANGLFGHTATRHSLPTRRQEAAQNGLFIGSRVFFSHQQREISGFVTYLGKTATIMVPDSAGEYRDRRGRRFAKYRVPLSNLKLHP